MNKPILHFHEVRSTLADYADISRDDLAVYGLLAYINNDLNVFAKLLGNARSLESEDKPIQLGTDIQHNALLRTFAGKVFEAYEFLKSFPDREFQGTEKVMQTVARSAQEIEALASDEGFALSRNLRNESAFHYSFSTAKKNLQSAPDDLGASIYVNTIDGNSLFEFGEQLMFVQRMRRFSEANHRYEDVDTLTEAWLGWVRETHRLIRSLQSDVLGVMLERLADTPRRHRAYFVDPRLVSTSAQVLPAFWKIETE